MTKSWKAFLVIWLSFFRSFRNKSSEVQWSLIAGWFDFSAATLQWNGNASQGHHSGTHKCKQVVANKPSLKVDCRWWWYRGTEYLDNPFNCPGSSPTKIWPLGEGFGWLFWPMCSKFFQLVGDLTQATSWGKPKAIWVAFFSNEIVCFGHN